MSAVARKRPTRSADWRNPDMVSVRANLLWLHAHTHEEEHETVHLIAEGLGADKDWLHDAAKEQAGSALG